MRQKSKRDLIALAGVVVVIAILLVVNYSYNIGALAEVKDKERRAAESGREQQGMEILKWRHMRATEGNLRKGAQFTEELMAYNNTQVNLIGFMVPENTFRDMSEFMLLPLPIECYFCKRPPVHDVMMIQMEEGTVTQPYEQPVLINGVLRLHEGPNQKAFYSIDHAALEPAEKGGRLDKRYIAPEHMLPQHTQEEVLQEGIDVDALGK